MLRCAVLALVAVCAGCGDNAAGPAADAGVTLPDAQDASAAFDFYGETCTDDPPANTECHDGTGWCVAGTCRPMCGADRMRCAAGRELFAPAGACYCSPE